VLLLFQELGPFTQISIVRLLTARFISQVLDAAVRPFQLLWQSAVSWNAGMQRR
jgi:hypothetical protein